MGQYTEYPDHLKKRIAAVDAFITDVPKFRAWWESLPEEERNRIDALPPEQRQAEIAKLRGDNPDPNPPNPDPNAAGETVASLMAKLEKAEQRYRTLQGMIKEPAELERQNNVLLTQIKMLQDQLYELTKKTPAGTETKKEPKKIEVREALRDHYASLGEDLAPEIIEKEIKKDERLFELARESAEEAAYQRISEVAAKMDGQFKLSKEEQFYRDLDDWGDWKRMWATPEFQAFLAEEADVTGVERYAIIADAFKRLDTRVVIRAFDLFSGKGKRAPAPKSELDAEKFKNRLGAPRSSGASIPGDGGGENQNKITPLQARKMLADLASNYSKGLYVGKKEEYDKEFARLSSIARSGQG